MHHKNIIEISSSIDMCFYGYFLINFLVLVRRAEAITWENFVPAKRDPGMEYKRGIPSCRDETFYVQLQDVIYEEFITLLGSRLSRTEFHPGQPRSCNHHLTTVSGRDPRTLYRPAKIILCI